MLLQARHPQDPTGAEAALRRALALDPGMVDASAWLANALIAQGRDGESLAVMERAAGIDPLASRLIDNLAIAYAERGQFARAERMLRTRLELPQPSDILSWTLADLYWLTGQLVEANEMAKHAALADAESSGRGHWYGLLSLSYARLGLWEAAEYWLEQHAREWPDQKIAKLLPFGLNRYQLLRLQGRHEEVAQGLRAALRSEGGSALSSEAAAEFGLLLALAGAYSEAIPILEAHVDIEPPIIGEIANGADARHALVWAYLQTGAARKAADVLDALEQRYRELQSEGRLHLSGDLYLFAQNAVLAGDEEAALVRLQQAFDAGWRDYYFANSDPRWQPVSDTQRFRDLMNAVKADVDAQRARVQQIDASDDFVARLDRSSREQR